MKQFYRISMLTLTFIFLSSCVSIKFEDVTPFQIYSSNYYISKDRKETKIYVSYSSKDKIDFKNIYFLNQKSKLTKRTIAGKTYIFASFPTYFKRDIILDNNSTKEFSNSIPNSKKTPFKLQEKEIVINYKEAGKIKYHKILSIKKVEEKIF
ncbi:hypothetical protein [Polaribacter porphyrae]|nr:hypothetical protein [Polaribacter porphyrae]